MAIGTGPRGHRPPRHRFGAAVVAIGLVAARRAVAQVAPAVAAPDEDGIASGDEVGPKMLVNLLDDSSVGCLAVGTHWLEQCQKPLGNETTHLRE